MDQIFNLLGVGLTWVVAIIGGLLAAFWVGLIIWTWRDIRSRSADIFAAILATLLVAVFSIIGLLIYLLVRPKHTLAEQYDRALEEEILLRELEQAPTCFNCGRPVKPEWQYCPYCETELKHPCPQCGYLLEPEWKRCPQCGAPAQDFTAHQHNQQAAAAPTEIVPPPATPVPEPENEPELASAEQDEQQEAGDDFAPPPETVAIPEAEAVAKAQEMKNPPPPEAD